MDQSKFKQCPKCDQWFSIRDILEDPKIVPKGMMFEDLETLENIYLFNHVCKSCGTTFVIPVEEFGPLIRENIPPEPLTGTLECKGHCREIDDLSVCEAECKFAPYRRFLLAMLKRREKQAASEPSQDG